MRARELKNSRILGNRGGTAEPFGRYIPTFDGWRALAVMAAILSHSALYLFSPRVPWGIFPSASLSKIASYGGLGVDFFFGLSGYLITSRLLHLMREDGKLPLIGFYLCRFFRIMPAAFLYLVVLVVLAAVGTLPIPMRDWFAALLMFRNYLPVGSSTPGWFTGHLWSLSVEEHFYLLWPFALAFLYGRRGSRVGVFVACLVIMIWRYVDAKYLIFSGLFGVRNSDFRSDVCLDHILWGCLAALLMEDVRWLAWTRRWLNPWTWAAILGVFVLSVKIPIFSLQVSLQGALVPMLLIGTALNTRFWLSRLLETPPLRWLGRISYSLYLWQEIFLPQDDYGPVPFSPRGHWVLSVACAVVCAYLSYRFIETPSLSYGNRLASRLLGKGRTREPMSPEVPVAVGE